MATMIEGDKKASFSITTTLRCRGRHYSFPWIAALYLDLYLIMLSVKQGGASSNIFSIFDITRPGIESWSPWPLAKTLSTLPILTNRYNLFIVGTKLASIGLKHSHDTIILGQESYMYLYSNPGRDWLHFT